MKIATRIATKIAKVEAIALIPSVLIAAFYSFVFARETMMDFWLAGLYDSCHKSNFPVDAFIQATGEIFMNGLPCIAIMAVVVAIIAVIVTVRNNKK